MPTVLLADLPASIATAVRVLRDGGLVAFPTETVYGLGGLALDPVHIARIFAAKGRPTSHPLIAHTDGAEGARALAQGGTLGEQGERLAAAFWPGPLTLVVPRAAHVPSELTGGGPSVAIRVPAHPAALALLRALGEPLAAPSANRYQTLSPTLAEHVVRSLGDRVALVLDGGPCDAGIESTVVDVRGDVPRVLRPGALSLAALRAVCPDVVLGHGSVVERDDPRASPGLDPKHYAPRARLVVVSHGDVTSAIRSEMNRGHRVGALVTKELSAALEIPCERLEASPEGYGHELFAALHRLDESGLDVVVVERVPDTEDWTAVRDRLTRASSSSVP